MAEQLGAAYCIKDRSWMQPIEYGWAYRCECCGAKVWRYPKPCTLQEAIDAPWS